MQNPRLGALASLIALTALTALGTPGCKAKLPKHDPDASAYVASMSRKATESQLTRVVTHYLTAHVKRTHRPGGEQLIAFDRLKGNPTISPDGANKMFRSRARVFVRTPSGEDQTRIERIRCGLEKTAAGWTITVCTVGPTLIQSSPAHALHPEDDPLRAQLTGVPECDALIRFYKCIQKKLPAASRAAMSKSYRSMIQTFRKMAANPATRKTIVKTCTTAVAALRKSARNVPLYKGCI